MTGYANYISQLIVVIFFSIFLTLGGCQTRLSNILSPAPRKPVQTAELPPISNPNTASQSVDPNAPAPPANTSQPFDPTASANTTTPTSNTTSPAVTTTAQISRADMLGAWTITNGQDSCQLFMTLTTWTGGYRATTKGCNTNELANITAWDLSNNQIILVGATGTQVATLNSVAANRFTGQTRSGEAVNVSR